MTQTMQHELRTFCDQRASEEERRRALQRLKTLGDPSAIVPLASLLPEIEAKLVDDVRGTLSALGALPLLSSSLREAKPEARALAARLLGYLLDAEAVQPLITALDDPDAKVRELAAGALVDLSTPAALEPLVRHLRSDPDPTVRAAAAQALGQMEDSAAYEALSEAVVKEPNDFTRVIVELSHERARKRRDRRELWS